MSSLGKRTYNQMQGSRRSNIGPLLPSSMGGGFRRFKRSSVGTRKTYSRSSRSYNGRPNQELKFFDTTLSFAVDATGEVPATGQLALIPQGDTATSRDGRLAYVRSISIHGRMNFAPAAAATATTSIALYLVLDTQTNGAAAAWTDVFTDANYIIANRNLDNAQRFKILKKWVYQFTAQAGVTTAYNNTQKLFSHYMNCDIPINYSSTTGAIGEIKQNNIFLLAGSDGTSDDLVNVAGVCRLRFYD